MSSRPPSCQTVRSHLSPYLDSELDAGTTYAIARHLEGCASCARLVAGEERLERAIAERLRAPQGDEEQVFERALSRALPGSRPRVLRWLLGAAALALVALGLGLVLRTGREPVPELLAMVAKDHARYLRGELEPELVSADPAALSEFLAARTGALLGGFPAGEGWALEGARVCRFEGAPVAFVTLRWHGIPISLAELPAGAEQVSDADAHARCWELAGGRGVVVQTPRGLRAAFGAVEMARLEEVLRGER